MPERRAGRAMPVLRQDECRVRMRLAFFCIRQIKGFPCGGAIFLDDFMCGASNRWAAAFELPGRFIVEKRRQSKGL